MTNLTKIHGDAIATNQDSRNLLPEWIAEMEKDLKPIQTTIKGIDSKIGGFFKLSVIGGGPGTGKSALAIQAAENYAIQGGPVFYLAFEEGPDGFFSRILQRISGISVQNHRQHIRSNQLIVEELTNYLEDRPNLRIYGMPETGKGFDFEALKADILKMQEVTKKAAFVVVDSLHYTPLDPIYDNLDGKRKIDKSLQIFTDLRQSTKATITMIAHQTKNEVKAADNDLMSFSGSATIAYAVDMAFQLTTKDNPEILNISVPKNRLGMKYKSGIDCKFDLKNQIIS